MHLHAQALFKIGNTFFFLTKKKPTRQKHLYTRGQKSCSCQGSGCKHTWGPPDVMSDNSVVMFTSLLHGDTVSGCSSAKGK